MIRRAHLLTVLILVAGPIGAQQPNVVAHIALTPVSVPFVGCETSGHVSLEMPKALHQFVLTSPGVAAKLAYYKSGDGLAVLAPRGWYCFGTVGSGGDQPLVTPEPIDRGVYFSNAWLGFQGSVVIVIRRFGDTSGRDSVAEIITRIFPDHGAFAESVKQIFPFEKFTSGPYPRDKLSYRSKTVAEYTTPARTDGLGTYTGLKKNDVPVDGVAILIEQAPPDVLLLSVRLAPDFAGTISTIVHQIERDTQRHPQSRF